MTDIRNVGQEVQAEILKTVRKSQETVVGAIKTWSGTVRTMTPALSDLNLPFASKLPKPEELAGNAYTFAMKLLADQRKFAEGVLHSTGQLRPRTSGLSAGKTGTSGTAAKHDTADTPETAAKHETRKTGTHDATGKARTTGKTGTSRTTDTSRTAGTTRKTGPTK
jgi:hypothetical protein